MPYQPHTKIVGPKAWGGISLLMLGVLLVIGALVSIHFLGFTVGTSFLLAMSVFFCLGGAILFVANLFQSEKEAPALTKKKRVKKFLLVVSDVGIVKGLWLFLGVPLFAGCCFLGRLLGIIAACPKSGEKE